MHKWESWESKVIGYIELVPFHFHLIMVPTATSVSYGEIMERVKPLRPCLFAGDSGTAKTLTLETYISTLPVDNFILL